MSDQATVESVAEKSAGNSAEPAVVADKGSAASAGSWFDGLSEGNRKLAETKGWTTPDSADKVLSSYAELERQQGDALKLPPADAKPEDWDKFYSRLPEDRRPVASPDKIEFKRPENLPPELPYSDDLANASKPWMVKAKLNPGQAQSMHDDFTGYMAELTKAQQAEVAKSVETTHEEVVKAWGPVDSEGFKTKLALANRAMKELGLVDAYKGKGILLQDGSLTDPQIAKAFAAIGEAMFKEDTIGNDSIAGGDNPFKKDAAGQRSVTAMSALVKNDPEKAKRLIREAGEDPAVWMPNNPL